jgi:formylglycine-generating enzyme required for sulfatase activity
MGSDPVLEYAPEPDEAPRHSVSCPAFRIGRTPVTNAQYRIFVEATNQSRPSHWPRGRIPEGRESHPVTYVSWSDALAFCRWAGGGLASELQWERAARGDDDRTWPWGDEPPTDARASYGTTDTSPVGIHPRGASPFGVVDLAGNVWEWTATAMRAYPYDVEDGREDEAPAEPRVVRGGAYSHGAGDVRCSFRHGMLPGAVDHYVGFRFACSPTARLRLELDLVEVPAGEVLLGNDPRPSGGPALPDEAPRHTLFLSSVLLGALPVTNEQYLEFVRETGHEPPPHWLDGAPPAGLEQHPVTYVDWFDAGTFCRWAGARLPTEAEWEKGARGTDARIYPWGERIPEAPDLVLNQHKDPALAAFGAGPKRGTTAVVGVFPDGASPYGLLDMAGNVWEWVSTAYAPYPYRSGDGREDPSTGEPRVLRGGSFASTSPRFIRCASRSRSSPGRRSAHIGFRVARDAHQHPGSS